DFDVPEAELPEPFNQREITVSAPALPVEDTEKGVIAQSGLKPFQPTSDCLTDIVKTIHNISRSIQCSFITQSELVYKILVNNLDIVEREEIEEHLEVLVNKVPDWITKSFNKGMDLKSEMLT
nr:hypothetical protein [Tanacetum cinerariifolium]